MTRCPEQERIETCAGGFLDPREAARIRRHAARCASCGRALEHAEAQEEAVALVLADLAADEESVACPEPARLGAFFEEELPAYERAEIEAHLAACRLCRDAVLAARTAEPVASARALEVARERVRPAPPRERRRGGARIAPRLGSGRLLAVRPESRAPRRTTRIAAAAVAAAALVAFLGLVPRADSPPEATRAAAAPGAAAPDAAAPPPPGKSAPVPARGRPPAPRLAPEPTAEADPEDATAADGDEVAMAAPSAELPLDGEPAAEPTVARAGDEAPRERAPGASGPRRAAPARDGLVLASIAGPIEVRRRGESAWQPAREGDVLAAGDGLRGGTGTFSNVELAGRATLGITQATLLVAGEAGEALALSLERGAVEVAAAPRADVIVRTSFAEASATGARFRAERTGDEMRVRCGAGAVRFAAGGARVTLASGDESDVRAGEQPWAPRASSRKKSH
jgi:ferric-dicitrate binding protein FerR (iron transport regulator)